MAQSSAIFDEIAQIFTQFGKAASEASQRFQAILAEKARKDALVRIATTIPCSRGVSPFRIDWAYGLKIRCPQCRNTSVEVLIIYIECWSCGWHKKRSEFR